MINPVSHSLHNPYISTFSRERKSRVLISLSVRTFVSAAAPSRTQKYLGTSFIRWVPSDCTEGPPPLRTQPGPFHPSSNGLPNRPPVVPTRSRPSRLVPLTVWDGSGLETEVKGVSSESRRVWYRCPISTQGLPSSRRPRGETEPCVDSGDYF